MAESYESVKETLKREITCPLCLNIFEDPKRLPCDHVYCQQCIHAMFVRNINRTMACPECRTPTQVPNNDVRNFPTPHQINRLKEMYKTIDIPVHSSICDKASLPTTQDSIDSGHADTNTSKGKPLTCTIHKSKNLTLYCETCEKLVCRDCIQFFCTISKHEYGYVEDIFDKYKSRLNDKLHPARELLQRMSDSLESITALEHKLEGEEKERMAEVETCFQALFEVLHEEKKSISESTAKKFQSAKMDASAKKLEVTKISSDLKDVIAYTSDVHQHESKATYLEKMRDRERHIDIVTRVPLETSSSHLVEDPCIGVSLLGIDQLKKICKERNFQYNKTDPNECHFDSTVADWDNIPLRSPTFITLYIKKYRSKLHAHLFCKQTKEKVVLKIVQSTSASFILSFQPKTRGKHELCVRYDGKYICCSPIQVHVTVDPVALKQQLPSAVNLSRPMGIKCCEGHVYVSELGRGLAVLEACTLVRLNSIPMSDVWEVFIDAKAGFIYGTSIASHELKKMTMQGEVVKSVGGKGVKAGQFNYPNGIRCSNDNKILICDSNNHRIQVFNKDLNFLHDIKTFDRHYFGLPNDLDFDSSGNMYVVDQNSSCIHVITPERKYVRSVGVPGGGPGELNDPMSVAVYRGLLYVTDHSNKRVSVFKKTGQFITTFGEGILKGPECVAIDENGYIYISDNRSQVYVF